MTHAQKTALGIHKAKARKKQFNLIKASRELRELVPLESKYDPTDIATDEELNHTSCDCLVHTRRRSSNTHSNYMTYWSDWGDPI